jgi:hypothetical protein
MRHLKSEHKLSGEIKGASNVPSTDIATGNAFYLWCQEKQNSILQGKAIPVTDHGGP